MNDIMLTTVDNPFNPFTEFERWWKEDLRLGHDCCGLLALNANTSEIFSDEVNQRIINQAMIDIVEFDPSTYIIVKENDYEIVEN